MAKVSSIRSNKVCLAGAEEVCRTRDLPLDWNGGQRDTVGGYAGSHDPDAVLADS